MNADDDALHTGDDDRLDLVTSILAACDSLDDDVEADLDDVVQNIRVDCQKLDALLIATIKREAELKGLLEKIDALDATERRRLERAYLLPYDHKGIVTSNAYLKALQDVRAELGQLLTGPEG